MRFFTVAIALLNFLFVAGCAYACQSGKEEVIFSREYREYGRKEYGSDAVKLPHPIQILVDFYLVEYRLDATHLTITKVSAAHSAARTMLFTASLNRAQRQAVQQVLHTTNPSLLEQQCNSNTAIVDDGFQLGVTFTKAGVSRSFSWNGNEVPELITFLEVVNKVSPKKYSLYEPSQQEAFKQSLLHP